MFDFPWSNFHELNLDWILKVVKEAMEVFKKGAGDIQRALETSEQALETAEQAASGVIGDGAITIPKMNDITLKLFAYVVSGSVNDVFIPENALVIIRKSTIPNIIDGIYIAAVDIAANSIITQADLIQPIGIDNAGGLNYLLDKIAGIEGQVDLIENNLVIIVDGDTATEPVLPGDIVYIKNNLNGLADGFYYNYTANTFPATGGIADGNTFASSNGNWLNILKTSLTNIVQTGTNATQAITKGFYFYLNGILVQATADIESGSAFDPNSNYAAVTVGGLNEIVTQLQTVEVSSNCTWLNPTQVSGNGKYIYKSGNIVVATIDFTATSLTGNSGNILQFPNSCKPTGVRLFQLYAIYGSNAKDFCGFRVTTDGKLQTAQGSSTFNGRILGTVAFPI